MKRFIASLIAFSMLLSIGSVAFASEIDRFSYHENGDGSIAVTGMYGTLSEGQDLSIPSTIDGKPVTTISGTFGNSDGYDMTGNGTRYGTLTLPDTVTTLSNFTCHGFTGTLEIPSSVTTITGNIGGSTIEKLILNASVRSTTEQQLRGFRGLKELVVGGTIEYLGGYNFCDSYQLEKVYLSDNFKGAGTNCWPQAASNLDTIFYLNRFETTYYPDFSGATTTDRAAAVGVSSYAYVYLNEPQYPVESISLSNEYLRDFGDIKGVYIGESRSIGRLTILPANTTDRTRVKWSSSDPSVASVSGGAVRGYKAGTVVITASKGGKSTSVTVEVRERNEGELLYRIEGDSVTVTGYRGTQAGGESLVIPSTIDGKPVTTISGTFGNSDGYDMTGNGTRYGTLTLPDTVTTLSNFTCHGFTGTLEIPSSVTTITGNIGGSTIEKLILNASVRSTTEQQLRGFRGLKELVVGGTIEYLGGYNFCDSYQLEKVYLSDNFKGAGTNCWPQAASNLDTIFYLNRFETTYYPDFSGATTTDRAAAVGVSSYAYVYLNEPQYPVESISLSNEYLRDFGDIKGVYIGESRSIGRLTILPANTTDRTRVKWSSSDPSVASVSYGAVHGYKAGTAVITATKGGKSASVTVEVRDIAVNSTSNGVEADDLLGNIDFSEVDLDTNQQVSIDLVASEVDENQWDASDYLKEQFEQWFSGNINYRDIFEIFVTITNGQNKNKVQPYEGSQIPIWIPISNQISVENMHLMHIRDDNTFEELEFTCTQRNGREYVHFETDHFSKFALVSTQPEYTVKFDANGGIVTPSDGITNNGRLTLLPTPTRGSYEFSGWFTAACGGARVDTNTVFTDNSTIYAQWIYADNSDSSSTSDDSRDSETENLVPNVNSPTISTETKTDAVIGSTTVTEIKQDGTVVETITNTDRSSTTTVSKTQVKETSKGTTTTTVTNTITKHADGSTTVKEKVENVVVTKDGSTTATTTIVSKNSVTGIAITEKTAVETFKKVDGSEVTTSKTEMKSSDGSAGITTVDEKGKVTTTAQVSSNAIRNASKEGIPVALMMSAIPVARDTELASVVSISLPKNAGVTEVEIPVVMMSPGVVAVIVSADGTEKLVATSGNTGTGVALKLDASAVVKIIDNSKRFVDVLSNDVFYNEVCALSARKIMVGKTDDKFDLYSNVTLNQIANIAGRIIGAVDVSSFNSGIAWGQTYGLKTGNVTATRGDVLKALYIAAGSPGVEDTSILTRFTDATDIPADLMTAAAWAAENSILKGDLNSRANLNADVTRGQACALAGRTMVVLA